ncbi:MAG: hypothetical protein WCP55_08095, partial [Lentisphaerota bacterium]
VKINAYNQIEKALEKEKPKETNVFKLKTYSENRVPAFIQVVDIPDKEHELGKMNGTPATWWVKDHGGDLHPYIDKCVNRPCWEVSAEEYNTVKYKWDNIRINGHCRVNIKCDGRIVYSFVANDIHYALVKAHELIYKLGEHPFDFKNPDKEIGRKVWYHEQPAVIERLYLEEGCVYFRYDGNDKDERGFDMTHAYDWKDNPENEWNGQKVVRDDILAPSIWWFRE